MAAVGSGDRRCGHFSDGPQFTPAPRCSAVSRLPSFKIRPRSCHEGWFELGAYRHRLTRAKVQEDLYRKQIHAGGIREKNRRMGSFDAQTFHSQALILPGDLLDYRLVTAHS